MKFTKPALTYDEQADLLLQRGMSGNRSDMIRRLERVSYYRLSGYWFPFQEPSDQFKKGTTFDHVWDHYVFDRKLRLLVLDALERIEVDVRASLSYELAHTFGSFGYASEPKALPKLDTFKRKELLKRIQDEIARNKKEQFIKAFNAKYGADHSFPPIWIATEVLSFGTIIQLWQSSPRQVKKATSGRFGLADEVFRTWLWTMNEVRNVCAHHSRLWNRTLGNKPMIPKGDTSWSTPVNVGNDRLFVVLTMIRVCLRTLSPKSSWTERLEDLLAAYPKIPKTHMGIAGNWQSSPLWSKP